MSPLSDCKELQHTFCLIQPVLFAQGGSRHSMSSVFGAPVFHYWCGAVKAAVARASILPYNPTPRCLVQTGVACYVRCILLWASAVVGGLLCCVRCACLPLHAPHLPAWWAYIRGTKQVTRRAYSAVCISRGSVAGSGNRAKQGGGGAGT